MICLLMVSEVWIIFVWGSGYNLSKKFMEVKRLCSKVCLERV